MVQGYPCSPASRLQRDSHFHWSLFNSNPPEWVSLEALARAINTERCHSDSLWPGLPLLFFLFAAWICKRCMMARPLERALDTMVSTFHKYSGKEGDKFKLNKAELKELVTKELPSYISKQTDEASFQRLMNNLDSNRDKEVDFQEYATFLACVAMMCNEDFQDCPDKMPRKA